jgi:hypothetical protein
MMGEWRDGNVFLKYPPIKKIAIGIYHFVHG